MHISIQVVCSRPPCGQGPPTTPKKRSSAAMAAAAATAVSPVSSMPAPKKPLRKPMKQKELAAFHGSKLEKIWVDHGMIMFMDGLTFFKIYKTWRPFLVGKSIGGCPNMAAFTHNLEQFKSKRIWGLKPWPDFQSNPSADGSKHRNIYIYITTTWDQIYDFRWNKGWNSQRCKHVIWRAKCTDVTTHRWWT